MGLGSEIRDPEKTHSGSQIQGSKRHRILDPGSRIRICNTRLNQDQKIKWKNHGYPSLTAAERQLLVEESVQRQLLGYCRHTQHFD
jgi:hypothetical protein